MIDVQSSSFHEAGLLKLNCDKALHDLSWKPSLNFLQTIDFTAKWYVDYYQNKNITLAYINQQILEYTKVATSKEIEWASM